MRGALVLAFLFWGLQVNAQMILSVDGVASFDGVSFNINKAGEDFSSSIESESSVSVSVDFQNILESFFNPNKKWRMEVTKEDVIWNNNIVLEIKRAGDGSGSWLTNHGKTHLNGGENYQVVDGISRDFFNGKGGAYFVPLQLKLTGFSVTLGAQDFETNVVLTIYDD